MGDTGKYIVAGFVATLIMTLVGYFVPPLINQPAQDYGAMLGGMMFSVEDNYTMALIAGLIIHFIMGTIILALIYGYILYPILPGPGAVKGLIWGVILYLLYQIVVIPMMPMIMGTGGFEVSLMFGGDILGLTSIWSLINHLIYGLLLGAIGIKTE